MKMKSIAMVAISGLLAASCAFITPAMAEDAADAQQSMQPGMDNSAQPQNPAMPMASGNGGTPADMNASGSGNADEGGPDTATGDDDY